MEYQKASCLEVSGELCLHCKWNDWIGPKCNRISQPILDPGENSDAPRTEKQRSCQKSIAKTAFIDNDDNDNEDCDVDSNFDSDSEEEALAISAHTVNPPKEEPKNLRTYRLSFLN